MGEPAAAPQISALHRATHASTRNSTAHDVAEFFPASNGSAAAELTRFIGDGHFFQRGGRRTAGSVGQRCFDGGGGGGGSGFLEGAAERAIREATAGRDEDDVDDDDNGGCGGTWVAVVGGSGLD